MSNPFSTPDNLDPEAGFTHATHATDSPDIAKAANDLRNAAGEKAREFAATAEAKAHELKDRAIESAQQFRSTAVEKAAALKVAATDRAQHFRESATGQWEDTRVKAKELHVTAEDYIRQNPTKCVLSALGVGFLIGLIVRR
ncbi:MAG: DUF883 family protein [Akkermansiaceae bacterium]|nr:DUF883 family protein [Akkermansiaceae bacterium]